MQMIEMPARTIARERPGTLVYDINDNRYINIGKSCTLRCTFCPKQHGHWQVHDYSLQLNRLPTASEIIDALGDIGCFKEIVFCGFSEPTLRLKVLMWVARWIKSQGGFVRVNTDGLGNLVHGYNILPALSESVDALSISLNAQNEILYQHHCQPQLRGSYHSLREFILLAPQYIKQVTVTAIDGLEGVDIGECAAIAHNAGAIFRRRQLDVVG